MSLPNIFYRPNKPCQPPQDADQTAGKSTSVSHGGAHLRDPASPAMKDFLDSVGLHVPDQSMGSMYPGDRPLPENEVRRLIEDLNDVRKATKAPSVRPPATAASNPPPDPQYGATGSNPLLNNSWIIG